MSPLGRIVVLIWLFFVLIINSSYTAGLTSILTVQQLSSPIKGIESLKDGDDIIGYHVGSFAEQYLTNEIGIPKSRLKALGSPDEYDKALLQGLKKGGVTVVVDELPYVEVFLSSHCKFRIVGQASTSRSGWGFAFPRDSQLAVDLSTAILTLSENGDLQRIQDKWFTKSLCTTDDTEIESNRLHMSSFWGLFLMCGIVCILALMIYSWQIIHKYRKVFSVKSASNGHGSSHSIRLQTLISLIDQKKDQSHRGRKRRKLLSDAN